MNLLVLNSQARKRKTKLSTTAPLDSVSQGLSLQLRCMHRHVAPTGRESESCCCRVALPYLCFDVKPETLITSSFGRPSWPTWIGFRLEFKAVWFVKLFVRRVGSDWRGQWRREERDYTLQCTVNIRVILLSDRQR